MFTFLKFFFVYMNEIEVAAWATSDRMIRCLFSSNQQMKMKVWLKRFTLSFFLHSKNRRKCAIKVKGKKWFILLSHQKKNTNINSLKEDYFFLLKSLRKCWKMYSYQIDENKIHLEFSKQDLCSFDIPLIHSLVLKLKVR